MQQGCWTRSAADSNVCANPPSIGTSRPNIANHPNLHKQSRPFVRAPPPLAGASGSYHTSADKTLPYDNSLTPTHHCSRILCSRSTTFLPCICLASSKQGPRPRTPHGERRTSPRLPASRRLPASPSWRLPASSTCVGQWGIEGWCESTRRRGAGTRCAALGVACHTALLSAKQRSAQLMLGRRTRATAGNANVPVGIPATDAAGHVLACVPGLILGARTAS
jgi:hypothetical protein